MIFGAVGLVVVIAFVMIVKRSGKPRFETRDYYETYRRKDAKRTKSQEATATYSSRFDRDSSRQDGSQYGPPPVDQKKIAMVVIALAVVAIAISAFLGAFEGLLLIFTLPIIVRFIQSRRQGTRRRTSPDGEDDSSSV